jgi:unsaturated rhamnogalacturonyl hydrolase
MRLGPTAALLSLAALAGASRSLSAEASPSSLSPPAVLAVMEKVADWQLAHPADFEPTDWTQAAGYAGMMALAGISKSPRFQDAMLKMGEANGWRLGPRPYNADDHCVGQTYAELYLLRKDPRMIAPLRERFGWILAHPKDDDLDFDERKNPDRTDRWSWCDALFMGPPVWLRLYAATGEKAYLDYAVRHWWVTSDYLYDTKEHLFFRDSSYFDKREDNGRKVFWSRGNGWVIAGLVRVLQLLPADHPSRPRFLEQYRQMAERVLGLQQPDGLWRASLLDPESYPLEETSGSGFYCYALAWGVEQGLLDRARFEPAVRKAWLALVGCVDADGKLTHVQPIGSDPKRFDESATAPYGVGAFLLAGSEVYRMLGGVAPAAAAAGETPRRG